MSKFTKILVVCFLVSSCEKSVIVPVATAGSRADATITMSYSTGVWQPKIPDWDAAFLSATRRCNVWGYSRADAFEGITSICYAYTIEFGCSQETLSRTYQCVG